MMSIIFHYLLKNQFVTALVILALGWFIVEIREIIVAFFISYIIMAALSPFVLFLQKYKVPRTVAALIAYLLTIILLIGLIFPLVQFSLGQIRGLFLNFPFYLDRTADFFGITMDPERVRLIVAEEIDNVGRNALSVTAQVFGGLLSTITILVVSFYLLIDHTATKIQVASLFSKRHQEKVVNVINQIEEKLGAWLRGQIVLSLFIGLITWVVLTIVGLPYALPLAILAGILEVVPTLGPIIAAVPAVIVALTVSPTTALVVTGIYAGIQLLENNILVPRIMAKAVGLNTIIVILGIIIGGKLMGVAGALLSIPFISMVTVIVHNVRKT